MSRPPISQFDYVYTKTEDPSKGVSFKYTWKPQWRLPPGVKGSKVFMGVCFWLSVAAIPTLVYPYFRGEKTVEQKEKDDFFALAKKRNREDRMRWVRSDDMPPK